MNVVSERTDIVVITIVILQSYVNLACILCVSSMQENNLLVNRCIAFFLVYILYKFFDTAFVVKGFGDNIVFVTLVFELDIYTGIKKSLLSESFCKCIIIINVSILENLWICFEKYFCTFFRRFADFFQVVHYHTAFITLIINIFAIADFNFKPL